MSDHLTDDQLVDQLYCVSESGAHLKACHDCARRLAQIRERRAQHAQAEDISWDRLAAQRRAIYTRLGDKPDKPMKWVSAMAAVCLLAIGALMYRPAPAVHQDLNDSQLFSDVYSIEQSTEPLAAAPIHALFEDNQ